MLGEDAEVPASHMAVTCALEAKLELYNRFGVETADQKKEGALAMKSITSVKKFKSKGESDPAAQRKTPAKATTGKAKTPAPAARGQSMKSWISQMKKNRK